MARMISMLLASALLAAAAPAGATALFSSTGHVEATISVVGPAGVPGLAITGTGTVDTQAVDPTGTATGTAAATPSPLGTQMLASGDSLTLDTTATGSASDPGDQVLSNAIVSGQIRLENTSSTATFDLTLALSYALSASIAVDDPSETSGAIATLEVNTDLVGPLASLGAFADSNPLFGPPQDDVTDDRPDFYQFSLAPGQVELVRLQLVSGGGAYAVPSQTPEPVSLLLLGAGLLAAAGLRRR